MYGLLKIAVGIPALNAEDTIDYVIRCSKKHADVVVVVNDGSSDDTALISAKAGALVESHTENRGYGTALRSLFEKARAIDADALVILDSDGQHDPSEIPRVLKPIISGEADVVIGSRFMPEHCNSVPLYRKVGIKMLNLASRLIGVNVRDSQSGFRAYSKTAIKIVDPQDTGMSASVEILFQVMENGLKIVEVPITCYYGLNSSSQNPFLQGLDVFLAIIRHLFTEGNGGWKNKNVSNA